MKNVSVGSAAILAMTVAACSFRVGGNAQPAPQRPPPPGYAYGPQGGPPPGYAPQPGYAQPGTVANVGRPAGPQPGLPGPQPGMAPQQIQPSASFFEVVNIAQIQSLKARNPKACGFQEVAPNVWVRVDCHAYSPAARAIAHLSPRKASLVQNHQLQWRPHRFFVNNVRQAMFQRGSLDQVTAGGAPAVMAGLVRADNFPAAVDHRTENLEGPIKDQGPVGACTAFSLSSVIDNQAIRAGKMTAAAPTQAASANHVWAGYGFPQMGAAADATVGRTIATMELWGQSHSESCKIASPVIGDCGTAVSPPVVAGSWRSDPALVAKSDRANASGRYGVAGFERLDTQPPKVDQIMQALASGSDLWVAFKIDGFAWSNGQMRGGVIPDWDSENGGHAVALSGFRETPTGRQYLVHNSWGVSWGDRGYAWVSERMVQKWMHFAYQVKLADGVQIQPGQATDDDCGPDGLVDLFAGICQAICPNGTRPNGGCGGAAPAPPGGGAPAGIPGLPPGFQIPQIPGLTAPPAPAPSK